MPSLPANYLDFHGGFDTKDQPFLMTDETARDVNNIQATRAGAIVKRDGLQTFATPGGVATSLRAFESVSPVRLVGAVGTTLIAINPSGVISTIKTGLTNGVRWEFTAAISSAGSPLIFGLNGIDTPQQWDGSGGTTANWVNTSGSVPVPNGRYLVYANNQVYVAGVASAPSRVYWSAIGNPQNWDVSSSLGAGFQDFDPGDGQVITALGRVGPYVMVCKPRKIWLIIDPTTATTRRLSDNVGCIAHRSIATGPEGTYFLSEDRGVYLTNGSALNPISDSIQPTINVGAAGAPNAAGACFGGHYYLSMAFGGSNNDTTLDYDSMLQSWWKHTFGASQFTIWHQTNVPQLMQAKGGAAGIDQCFTPGITLDNGAPFKWSWHGPWQSPSWSPRHRRVMASPYYRKRLRQFRIVGIGTIDFSLAKNFQDTESLIRPDILFTPYATDLDWADASINWADNSALWAQGTILRHGRVYSLGVADAFSIVFSATSDTQDEVISYTLFMDDRKDTMP